MKKVLTSLLVTLLPLPLFAITTAYPLSSYEQSHPMSCGPACCITALHELGYPIPLNQEAEDAAYKKTGMTNAEIVAIAQKVGELSAFEGLVARLFYTERLNDERGSLPKDMFAYLQTANAQSVFWFDPAYIMKLESEDNAFTHEIKELGFEVLNHPAHKNSDLQALKRDDIDKFLDENGRVIMLFGTKFGAHYVLVRRDDKHQLQIMNPAVGKNFPFTEETWNAVFAGEPVSLEADFFRWFFLGVAFGIKP
jgi:hypothetical protein